MLIGRSVNVFLHPAQIRVANRPLLPFSQHRLVAQEVAAQSDGVPWHASMAALNAALEQRKGVASLHAVVSDHFVRYTSLPWRDNLVSQSDWLAYAKFTFVETYGNVADDWAVAVDRQVPGKASLACAMDARFLRELRQTAEKFKVRLTSVQTALCERINRHRRQLVAAELCLVSIESGRLTLAFRGHAGWIAVRQRRIHGNQLDSFPSVLKQEAATVGTVGGGTAYLVGEDISPVDSDSVPGWNLVCIDEPPPEMDETPAGEPAETAATELKASE